MRSSSSFRGRCATLLIGGLLVWYTVTNQRVASIAAAIFGPADSAPSAQLAGGQRRATGPAEDPPPGTPNPPDLSREVVLPQTQRLASALPAARARASTNSLPQSTGSRATSLEQQNQLRIEQISRQLKKLGASYLLLERLRGTSGDRYRVRCDLAHEGSALKCCFEVTRDSALRALEEVLEAVLRVDRDRRGHNGTSVATSM